MTKRRILLALIVAGQIPFLQTVHLHAESWLEDGRSCFCLKHEQNQMIRNCIGVKGPQDFYVTAICRGTEKSDQHVTLSVRPPWTPIQDGTQDCSPCRPVLRKTPDLPRQEDQ